MPANLPVEWSIIDEKYRREKDLAKKIELLKELMSVTPKHKGTENLMADLRKRMSRLEEELEKKSRRAGAAKKEVIKKTEDLLISILGFTQSGKSTLLKSLTNASVEINSKPYTTKEPITGVCFFEGANIQFVEIPSFFFKKHMNIAHTSDLLLILTNTKQELDKMEEILKENKLDGKNKIVLMNFINENIENKNYSELLNEIIKKSDVIRIFTKPIGKEVEKKAIVLKSRSSVKDLIERINKAWLKNFRFARIFDKTPFSGRKVGLEYVLKDGDIVEIHVL